MTSPIKSFARSNNILPTGDLRLKSTWLNAVQEFLTPIVTATTQAIATATSKEAIQRYKATAIVALRFTYRAFIVSCLLAIALGLSAADTFQTFKTWLESQDLTLNQPIAILQVIAVKTRKRVSRFTTIQTERAKSAIVSNAIQPATELRQRINAARSVITH
jgi:predicted PurR-regulated permease PerM